MLLLALFSVAVTGCTRAGSAEPANPTAKQSVPVTVATAELRDVPVQVRNIARAEPYLTVTVKPQVSGQISNIHFKEGQHVTEGEILVSIDARPFEAALQQAEAVLAKEEALAVDAEAQAKWQTELHGRGDAAQREYETAVAQAAALRAAVQADRAAVAKARLDLEYCFIRAPISGQTGARLADAGNVVKANETALVVLNQVSPLYVTFSVPEGLLGGIRMHQAAGALPVAVEFPSAAEPAEPAELTFINNQVDTTTGMIVLKATCPNQEHRLWPGQFLQAVLTLATLQDAVVVPARAVQIGQRGQFVYVVKDDATVEARAVETGVAAGEQVVIETGVAAGERVVTDGQLRLTPGASVQIREAQPPAASRPQEAKP